MDPPAEVAQAEREGALTEAVLLYRLLSSQVYGRQGLLTHTHTHLQSSLTLCKYLLLPQHQKHSLVSALENIMRNSVQCPFIHLEIYR